MKSTPKNTIGIIKATIEHPAEFVPHCSRMSDPYTEVFVSYGKACLHCGSVFISKRFSAGACSRKCSSLSSRRTMNNKAQNFTFNITPKQFDSEAEFWESNPKNIVKPKKEDRERTKRNKAD